ncbi:HEAT repeat-containing protein 6 [Dorcoceras hygrometricum]|uniref:HEAT repeat-containing protein 6 n=1 Tax=Dorcoceras hygrometricum TaxID=472368 RepID=A0A2Z7BF65_9LAMI|nr:HEAT repeat-containing protein 6 [Dorcoceras hygrometricum]
MNVATNIETQKPALLAEMSSAARSWRTTFLTLRDETLASPPALTVLRLVDELVFSQYDTLLSAAPDLSSHEVTSDLMFLMQLALNISRFEGVQDVTLAFIKLSNLFHGVCHCASLEINSTSWALVLDSFERMVEFFLGNGEKRSKSVRNVAALKATKQCLESLRRLYSLRQRAASLVENEKLLNFLLQVVGCFQGLYSSNFANGDKLPGYNIMWETLTVAFIMVGKVHSGVGSSLSVNIWQSIIEALSKVIDILASKSLLVEDKIVAKFYIELLHCLHLVVADPRGHLAGHVSGFVAALRMFFRYGLANNSYASNQPSSQKETSMSINSHFSASSKSGNVPYRPPHIRKKSVNNMQHEDGSPILPEKRFCKTYGTSSDSDCSDSDGSVKDNCIVLFAKARLGAIVCIQDLCRADSKSFTVQWAMLLPSSDVLQNRKYDATLMSCFLFDPNSKVRTAAGSTIMAMLDGPASVSLQVAEYKSPSKCGSFTSLSSSLGQILMQLHSGTLYLIKQETQTRLLELSFKILMLLVSSTPYSRMPEELLSMVISSVQSRINESFAFQSYQNGLLESAIGCLNIALSVSPSSMHVSDMLQVEVSTGLLEDQHKSGVLYTLFQYSDQSSSESVSLEAFQALKTLAHNYPQAITLCWEKISSIVYRVLSFSLAPPTRSWRSNTEQTVAAMKERVITASIKVLDECLRAVSGFRGTEDLADDKFLGNPFTSDYIKTKSISSAPSYGLQCPASTKDEPKTFLLARERWLEVTVKHMPLIIKHSSAMVRAASVTCFAGMTSSVFFSLCEDRQEFIISSSVETALNDDVPSVRSAACRAIGVIACFPQLYHSHTEILGKFIHACEHNICDPLVSVRIIASWSLANMCDSLGHCMNLQNPGREAGKSSQYIRRLADIALRLTLDNDKVKANAVRALGNLAKFIQFTSPCCMHGEHMDSLCSKLEFNGVKSPSDCLEEGCDSFHRASSENSEWLEKMVHAFLSCVTTGNVKVQWNVCHALSNLFFNKTLKLQDKDWAASVFSILLLLLRDSSNFKIRIQAAAALAVPETMKDYGRSYYDVVKGVEHIVENFNSNQISGPSNFKYLIALEKQLTSTMLHLLGLAARCDLQTVQEFLVRKAVFLELWVNGLCSSLRDASTTGDQTKNMEYKDQKKEVVSRTVESLIEVYERCNNHHIAKRVDEWKEPSEEALSGGRGMFCILPLAKALLHKSSESINFAASSMLKVMETPELISPKVVQSAVCHHLHNVASSVKKMESSLRDSA